MLHAVSAPLFKTIALGGLLLGTGVVAKVTTNECCSTKRLVLHAPAEANAIYLSAWDQGDVRLRITGPLHPITFEVRASVSDGCRWLGIERLEPIDERTYAYDYSEYILECDEGARPARKTPRKGIVTVE